MSDNAGSMTSGSNSSTMAPGGTRGRQPQAFSPALQGTYPDVHSLPQVLPSYQQGALLPDPLLYTAPAGLSDTLSKHSFYTPPHPHSGHHHSPSHRPHNPVPLALAPPSPTGYLAQPITAQPSIPAQEFLLKHHSARDAISSSVCVQSASGSGALAALTPSSSYSSFATAGGGEDSAGSLPEKHTPPPAPLATVPAPPPPPPPPVITGRPSTALSISWEQGIASPAQLALPLIELLPDSPGSTPTARRAQQVVTAAMFPLLPATEPGEGGARSKSKSMPSGSLTLSHLLRGSTQSSNQHSRELSAALATAALLPGTAPAPTAVATTATSPPPPPPPPSFVAADAVQSGSRQEPHHVQRRTQPQQPRRSEAASQPSHSLASMAARVSRRPAPYTSSLCRVSARIKVPHVEPEQVPPSSILRALRALAPSWFVTAATVRQGCTELELFLVALRPQKQQQAVTGGSSSRTTRRSSLITHMLGGLSPAGIGASLLSALPLGTTPRSMRARLHIEVDLFSSGSQSPGEDGSCGSPSRSHSCGLEVSYTYDSSSGSWAEDSASCLVVDDPPGRYLEDVGNVTSMLPDNGDLKVAGGAAEAGTDSIYSGSPGARARSSTTAAGVGRSNREPGVTVLSMQVMPCAAILHGAYDQQSQRNNSKRDQEQVQHDAQHQLQIQLSILLSLPAGSNVERQNQEDMQQGGADAQDGGMQLEALNRGGAAAPVTLLASLAGHHIQLSSQHWQLEEEEEEAQEGSGSHGQPTPPRTRTQLWSVLAQAQLPAGTSAGHMVGEVLYLQVVPLDSAGGSASTSSSTDNSKAGATAANSSSSSRAHSRPLRPVLARSALLLLGPQHIDLAEELCTAFGPWGLDSTFLPLLMDLSIVIRAAAAAANASAVPPAAPSSSPFAQGELSADAAKSPGHPAGNNTLAATGGDTATSRLSGSVSLALCGSAWTDAPNPASPAHQLFKEAAAGLLQYASEQRLAVLGRTVSGAFHAVVGSYPPGFPPSHHPAHRARSPSLLQRRSSTFSSRSSGCDQRWHSMSEGGFGDEESGDYEGDQVHEFVQQHGVGRSRALSPLGHHSSSSRRRLHFPGCSSAPTSQERVSSPLGGDKYTPHSPSSSSWLSSMPTSAMGNVPDWQTGPAAPVKLHRRSTSSSGAKPVTSGSRSASVGGSAAGGAPDHTQSRGTVLRASIAATLLGGWQSEVYGLQEEPRFRAWLSRQLRVVASSWAALHVCVVLAYFFRRLLTLGNWGPTTSAVVFVAPHLVWLLHAHCLARAPCLVTALRLEGFSMRHDGGIQASVASYFVLASLCSSLAKIVAMSQPEYRFAVALMSRSWADFMIITLRGLTQTVLTRRTFHVLNVLSIVVSVCVMQGVVYAVVRNVAAHLAALLLSGAVEVAWRLWWRQKGLGSSSRGVQGRSYIAVPHKSPPRSREKLM